MTSLDNNFSKHLKNLLDKIDSRPFDTTSDRLLDLGRSLRFNLNFSERADSVTTTGTSTGVDRPKVVAQPK